jgi:hypothetical protein
MEVHLDGGGTKKAFHQQRPEGTPGGAACRQGFRPKMGRQIRHKRVTGGTRKGTQRGQRGHGMRIRKTAHKWLKGIGSWPHPSVF